MNFIKNILAAVTICISFVISNPTILSAMPDNPNEKVSFCSIHIEYDYVDGVYCRLTIDADGKILSCEPVQD